MNKFLRFALIAVLFFLLVLVRAYGTRLFYDPFIGYFTDDYLHAIVPRYNAFKLFLHTFLRYFLNTIISLAIIYLFFQKKTLLIFSVKFYAVAFIILSLLYFVLLQIGLKNGHLFAFYARRFLIHPVLLLVLLPAFYYQQKLVSTSSTNN